MITCGAGDCTAPAVEVLAFRDLVGHVHNCARCAAVNREFCDVVRSAALVDVCPWPCTPEPIHTSTPTALGAS